MTMARKATASGIVRPPFLFLSPPGTAFRRRLMTISARTWLRRYWALVGCDVRCVARGRHRLSLFDHSLLAEAPVDLKALARNALALVGRQKQRQTCDVAGRHRIGNGL